MQLQSGSVEAAYRERADVVRDFFGAEAERLSELCHSMAGRFIRGGRLVAFGAGPAATDAQHVSVEFVHPVIVGKRALPALALPNDVPSTTSLAARDRDTFFARHLGVVGAGEDIALGMVHGPGDPGLRPVRAGLERAAAQGMLSVALTARHADLGGDADYTFTVDSTDPFVVQEVHETLYHVLWELVHVFFEHKGLLEDRPRGSSHHTGGSAFLYPFLAEAEGDLKGVLGQVGASILQKADDVIALREASRDAAALVDTCELVAERLADGGKLLALGNGGSATDAQDLVVDCIAPPEGYAAVPALSLTGDAAVLTAIGNDVGFENVFGRQVIAFGNPPDVLVAISTSGGSRNVLAAVDEARRRGLLTVALAGYGGGRLADICDRAHVVSADYIPRIQEAQATQYHLLRRLIGSAIPSRSG